MAEMNRNEMDVPFSREPLDMSKEYKEVSVKSSYEYETDTKNKYTGEKQTVAVNTTMAYPVTEEGLMQAAEFIKREMDAGHNIDANASIVSDSPMAQWVFLPVDKEKLEKSLAEAQKEELAAEQASLSRKEISVHELYNEVAPALEQFMFERGEYEYQSDEHVKWLAEANIPDNAGEKEARECILKHIKDSFDSPETIQQLIKYLDSELDVMDTKDESVKTANKLKEQLAAAQNSFYANTEIQHDSWVNEGDRNFAENGGVLVHSLENGEYEFLQLLVESEEDKYAVKGFISDLNDYKDADCLKQYAEEQNMSVEDLISTAPTAVVAVLADEYGSGIFEFSPQNSNGEYIGFNYGSETAREEAFQSIKVTDRELLRFMEDMNVPYEYFPDIENLDLSDHIVSMEEPEVSNEKNIEYEAHRKAPFMDIYVVLSDDALVDAVERSGVMQKIEETGEYFETKGKHSIRDLEMSNFNVYAITNGWEVDTHLEVIYDKSISAEVKLSSDEQLGLLAKIENELGKTVGNWIESETKEEPKKPKKDEVGRD